MKGRGPGGEHLPKGIGIFLKIIICVFVLMHGEIVGAGICNVAVEVECIRDNPSVKIEKTHMSKFHVVVPNSNFVAVGMEICRHGSCVKGSRCDGDRVFKGVSIDEGDDFSGVEIAAVLEEAIVVGIPFGSGGVWAWSTSMSHFEQSGPPGPILKVDPVPVPVPDPDIGFASGTKSVPEPDPKLNPGFDPGFASGTKSVFEPEPMFEPDPKLKPGSMPGTTSASGTKSDPVLVL
nr:hypothetical protein Iba_chr14bCG14140 [Ipomoea batatas]